MTAADRQYALPPVVVREDGGTRRVGFELEFSGISLDETAQAVCSALQGRPGAQTAAERTVTVDGLGEFHVELDWDFLKRKASEYERFAEGTEWLEQLTRAAALLVPVEVVCPPIPVTDLAVLEALVTALRGSGAMGTEDSLIAAYGIHINTEIPKLDAATLFAYLRAFALLQWWLMDTSKIDPARRVSPYIDPFSEAYLSRVLSRSDATLDDIFDDYLAYNPSRNRALDMLPLLAEIDEERVRRAVDDPRIKARPTFHYRLPNSLIDRADWSLAAAWNSWCVVEQLAVRHEDLDRLAARFLATDRPLIGHNRGEWVRSIDRWLQDHGLV